MGPNEQALRIGGWNTMSVEGIPWDLRVMVEALCEWGNRRANLEAGWEMHPMDYLTCDILRPGIPQGVITSGGWKEVRSYVTSDHECRVYMVTTGDEGGPTTLTGWFHHEYHHPVERISIPRMLAHMVVEYDTEWHHAWKNGVAVLD